MSLSEGFRQMFLQNVREYTHGFIKYLEDTKSYEISADAKHTAAECAVDLVETLGVQDTDRAKEICNVAVSAFLAGVVWRQVNELSDLEGHSDGSPSGEG